jgi:hypothetical protein
MSTRRFPPPWSVEELDACFIVKDSAGQKLAYVYFEEEPGPLRSRLSCSIAPSRIAVTISGALCSGIPYARPRVLPRQLRSRTTYASLRARQRRRARFASLRTMTTPTNIPSTKPP